ncbi:MAG: hypothetical protein GC160_06615 [Acidobacteria bacterium]|nr:hypothetical protein [Acidobacteriota bacterium]
MNVHEVVGALSDRLSTEATVRRVFGEPITVGERTVIPVAKVGYGFGAGGGGKSDEEEGGGGGGGARLTPAGVVELTPGGVEYVEFGMEKKILGAALLGAALGFVLGRLTRS